MKLTAATTLIVLALTLGQIARAENWPMWRGPRMDGTSLETNVPTQWNADSNVLWKIALPGVGHASPIIWEKRVFTVTCLPDTQAEEIPRIVTKDKAGAWLGGRLRLYGTPWLARLYTTLHPE